VSDLSALLDTAALPERTVEICLRGDLVSKVEDLERQLRDAQTSLTTLADAGRAQLLATEIESVREQMRAASVVFRLRGLNRQDWRAILAAHPPREDDRDDNILGYNQDTFFPALIRACLIEPDVDDETWARLEPVLSSKQFDDLADAALGTSRRTVDVPFSFAASATLRHSADESK
jgi:hypothetical protein